ncbi:Response regulator receiver domain protein [Thermus sp. CCB_US3_UF1]|uniref:response regulator n=2 Tax=unclassified Thermus TaxID=2619321 RepID=UPI00023895A1|nr:response regulator [Thermus sp. CCB_US3_UF1]AEV15776.1 Response regulator receiver domain protein [Thermus sp. CCB_US3_UF1]
MARILVVDDEPFMQHLVALLLEPLGHQVEVASSGEEALGLLDQNSYDLAVCDLVMPGMGGLALLRELHRRGGPPAIALSASVSPSMEAEARQAGAVAFLGKPFPRQELIRTVEAVLGGDHAHDPGGGR